MPRKQAASIDVVLDYFETAPLDVANLSLKLAARAIHKRETKKPEPGAADKPAPVAEKGAAPRTARPRTAAAPPAAPAAPAAPASSTTQAAPAGAPPVATGGTAPAV